MFLQLSVVMDGFREMTPTELQCHFPSATGGYFYSSFVVEGRKYTPYLQQRAEMQGLRVLENRVQGVSGSKEFCESAVKIADRLLCKVIINATGVFISRILAPQFS
jgi:hypothetical protein